LCEEGVSFVQVTYGDNTTNPRWDQHSNLPKHADHARAMDKPITGLAGRRWSGTRVLARLDG